MTVDPSVIPGLLFLLAELVALAGVGYVIVRVALRETDLRVALAQGLVVGPAIWGVIVNLVMYALPGIPGAVAGWIFVLALAAVLIWRSPRPIHPQLRTAALFALAALALFWIALAGRQVLGMPDVWTHIGLHASIREGLFPPELPWNPGTRAPYHHGVYILSGLLAPPSGPDSAFVQELLGAYSWISLLLVVMTTLWRRATGFAALAVTPLLLTAGGWGLVKGEPASIAEAPVPAGIPAAGLRAALMDIYWPAVELPYASLYYALPNIWKPAFTLSYALCFVVLACAAYSGRRSWPSVITLAALVGFLGLTSSTLAPIVLVLWAGLEAFHLVKSRRAGTRVLSAVARSVSGLALAAMLVLVGRFSGLILDDTVTSGLSLGTSEYFGGWRLLGTLERLSGGVGILGLGPLTVTAAAVMLARRNRLVLALAAGVGALLLASMVLNYEPRPWDLVRLEGHARNFALYALLIALGTRLAGLRPRWRYAAGAAIIAVIVWPTIAEPVRNGSLALGNGVELTNAQPKQYASGTPHFQQRFVLQSVLSDRVAAYIRDNTAVDAWVFSPHPHEMTYATGRPNASGFGGLIHFEEREGPAYRDMLNYLEPAAVRRVRFEYVHAPDSWVASLPDEAARRLNDPNLFELVVRDGSESLYRVLPSFLSLDTLPAPGSYEALRQAVPASATVFLSKAFQSSGVIRTAWALSHAELLGDIDLSVLHLRTPWRTEPLGNEAPDLVVTQIDFEPWMFPTASRRPVWWKEEVAVYALHGTVEPIMPPPPQTEPFPFSIEVSDVSEADGRISFTAIFDDRAPDQWTSQDWVIVATEGPRWHIPKQLLPDGSATIALWFKSYLNPGKGTTSLEYQFDFRESSLAVRREQGVLKPLERSEGVLDSDSYLLAVRLRHEYKPNQWRDAAIIPVLRIVVSETGEVSYQVHEDAGG